MFLKARGAVTFVVLMREELFMEELVGKDPSLRETKNRTKHFQVNEPNQ
jgi:hypothetical protein